MQATVQSPSQAAAPPTSPMAPSAAPTTCNTSGVPSVKLAMVTVGADHQVLAGCIPWSASASHSLSAVHQMSWVGFCVLGAYGAQCEVWLMCVATCCWLPGMISMAWQPLLPPPVKPGRLTRNAFHWMGCVVCAFTAIQPAESCSRECALLQ